MCNHLLLSHSCHMYIGTKKINGGGYVKNQFNVYEIGSCSDYITCFLDNQFVDMLISGLYICDSLLYILNK